MMLIRRVLFWLGMWPAYRCPFSLPRNMHERESYTFLFFFDGSRFTGIKPEIADWFRCNRIVYRLESGGWSPIPTFSRQRDLDAFIELEQRMRRSYIVGKSSIPRLNEWLKENSVLHVWDNSRLYLLSDSDAVLMTLRFEVKSRAEIEAAKDRQISARLGSYRARDHEFFERVYGNQFVVTVDDDHCDCG